MYKNKILIAFLFAFSVFQAAVSQNNTNSPYTRFGYGDVTENTPNELRGMGGVSLADRTNSTINPVNPASYSGVDSLTFMFDVATDFRFSRFSDLTASTKTFNANLSYLTLRFPIGKMLGFSAGLIPYSFTGYSFTFSDSIPMPVAPTETAKKINFTQSFNGNGGFSQLYSGLSLKAFNHVAVGVNAYYLFGNINNYRYEVESNSASKMVTYNNQIKASDFRLRYGLQLFNTFNKKHNVTLGFIYEAKTKLNGTYNAIVNVNNKDSVLATNSNFELPQVFGAGVNYNFNNKLTVGADYKLQSWKDVLFLNKKDLLVNSGAFSVGAAYIPNPSGRKTSDRICYRVGFNTSNPYYKIDTPLPNNFGLSAGVGIPMRDNMSGKVSYLNTSLEYGKTGSNSSLREDYLRITISAAFSELWFFKRKL